MSLSNNLILAYQSFGVVYGSLSTSPLYVYPCTFIGKLPQHQNEEVVFGAFSLIFWTLTLFPLLKYLLVLLSAHDNGQGFLSLFNSYIYLPPFYIFQPFVLFVRLQGELLLSIRCFVGMRSLAYFPTSKLLMRSSQLTSLVPPRTLELHPPLKESLKSTKG